MAPEQVEIALARAQRLCTLRGAQLTPVRRTVLELILRAEEPAKAYVLLAKLEHEHGGLAPPTVYRALDFLLAHRLIHKVETSRLSLAAMPSARTRAGS